ncbi:hypothetical protein C0992_006967 [Termitomyces sp. T32_za158]|nr:hypothetical protein C0992_006967 [Termitomyces sp. T32_za158]
MNVYRSSNVKVKALRQLKTIMRDKSLYRQLLQPRGSDAQALLNMFQKLMDDDRLEEDRKSLMAPTQRLSRNTSLYPAGFLIEGIKLLGDAPHAGGGFADIYRGEIDGAVTISREAIIWRQLSHPNVLPFLGLSRIQEKLFLVSPWAENGHINTYLKSNTFADRTLLCLDVATGLKYLHQNGTVHGDLKGVNILVSDYGRACVADFGLSSVVDPFSDSFRIPGGTINWQAPELLDVVHSSPPKNTTASDVYALACVCYEIFTGQRPLYELPSARIADMVVKGRRPRRPDSSHLAWTQWGLTEPIWALTEECWLQDPMARPKIDAIVRRLRDHAQEDKRSTASWVQIAVTRPKVDQVSFQRALEIIDEILRLENLRHFNALPIYYAPLATSPNVNVFPRSDAMLESSKKVCYVQVLPSQFDGAKVAFQ